MRLARLLAGMAALALFGAACGGSSEPEPSPTPASPADRVAALEFPLDMADGRFLGDAEAPLTLTIYEDFRCSHCLDFTLNIEPMLIDEYVEPGDLRIEFRHLPILGDASIALAVAAECAAQQDTFWPVHKRIFGAVAANEGLSLEAIGEAVAEAGGDAASFEACFDGEEARETVGSHIVSASEAGFTGTPSFELNGEPLPGQPGSLDGWRELLDSAME